MDSCNKDSFIEWFVAFIIIFFVRKKIKFQNELKINWSDNKKFKKCF